MSGSTSEILRPDLAWKAGQDLAPERREHAMGTDDKIRNAAEEAQGKIKEKAGQATDDERLEAEGKADQTKANLKQAGEKVKDAFE